MECTGKLINVTRNIATRKLNVTFEIEEEATGELDRLMECEKLSISATKFRKRRSLDANAYMWVLLQKIADVLRSDKWKVYMQMLSRYGQFAYIIVKPSAIDTFKAMWREVEEAGRTTINGAEAVQLRCYFGSHLYDTREMAILIDGIISEAKELGIETLPPHEIERMKSMWGVEQKSEEKEQTHEQGYSNGATY